MAFPAFMNKSLFDKLVDNKGLYEDYGDYILISKTDSGVEIIVDGQSTGYFIMRGSKLCLSGRYHMNIPRSHEYEYAVAEKLGKTIARKLIRERKHFFTIDFRTKHNPRHPFKHRYWSLGHYKSEECFLGCLREGFVSEYTKITKNKLENYWDNSGDLDINFFGGLLSVALAVELRGSKRHLKSTFRQLRNALSKATLLNATNQAF